jgi:drug/metabolite transporter (DMT)-like permease
MPNPIVGVMILLLSLSVLSVLDGSGKWILSIGVPLLIVAWFRYVVHFVLILALILSRRELHLFKSVALRFQVLRGIIILFTSLSFFTTLSYLPQAQATTMVFLAPFIMLALAPWLLGEQRRVSRWIAAALGFIGVMIVIRPGSGLDPVGVMFGLLTAALMALQHLITRKVAVDHALTTVMWSGLIGAVALSAFLPVLASLSATTWFDTLGDLPAWGWFVLLSLGVTGGVGHLLQIQAYRLAPASVLAPFMYTQIISATTIGWLIWGDFPDTISWFGIGIICASGAGIAWFEWHSARKPIRV